MRNGKAPILIIILIPIPFLMVGMFSPVKAEPTGKIVGYLTDTSGASIVGASVTAVGAKHVVMTGNDISFEAIKVDGK